MLKYNMLVAVICLHFILVGGNPMDVYSNSLSLVEKSRMPLNILRNKSYHVGTFFEANWFTATEYCRSLGMHLASISSKDENDKLEIFLSEHGLTNNSFWTSGTDLGHEGKFVWLATGQPLTFKNWGPQDPNNLKHDNGEYENCIELNTQANYFEWLDQICSYKKYFICETHANDNECI